MSPDPPLSRMESSSRWLAFRPTQTEVGPATTRTGTALPVTCVGARFWMFPESSGYKFRVPTRSCPPLPRGLIDPPPLGAGVVVVDVVVEGVFDAEFLSFPPQEAARTATRARSASRTYCMARQKVAGHA